MDKLQIKLNPSHDIGQYKADFEANGVVRIENLFAEDLAEEIHQILSRATPWHMVHSNDQGRHKYYTPDEWNSILPKQRQEILSSVMRLASTGFAYNYLCYPMIRAYLEQRDPAWPLHAMTEFLNSDNMLHYVKEITGNPGGKKIDGQATFYARGHFLNVHDDTGHEGERLAAYVMGFSKNWRPDWGGQLLFLKDGDVEQGFSPSFNTLTLFKVPRVHVVTQVTNFAGAGRYSITGWLRNDP